MAASETDICNLALGHLGEGRIQSLQEDSLASRACALHYGATLDQILRSHRWNFAQERVALARLATNPPFGWSYQFEMPADCLRVLEVNGSEVGESGSDQYILEGRKLLSNSAAVLLVYIRRVTDVSQWDSLFIEAFALKLAAMLSETIRGTTGKTAELVQMYERVTAPVARRVDANEGRRRKRILPLTSLAIQARSFGV